MKAVQGWSASSKKSTNLSGLRFLPSGYRLGKDGSFNTGQEFAVFWTGYKDQRGFPNVGALRCTEDYLAIGLSLNPREGYCVRCVKE